MTLKDVFTSSAHQAVALVLCAAMACACARKPAQPPSSKEAQALEQQLADLAAPSAATTATSTVAAQREAAVYSERRKPKAAVIGGCDERCEQPEGAVVLLFEELLEKRRSEGLYASFDWSLLEVDGIALGARWAEMWGRPNRHEIREKQIQRWLEDWSAWVDDVDDHDAIVRSRITGIEIRPLPGRSDVVEISYRHPKLNKPRGEAIWRLYLTRRGYEWLVSRIDHSPGKSPSERPLPSGSPTAGRL